ncbi:radical SAM/SPASM domain-containing protein [Candidatus Margulisiibacteriota bacterium]
MLKLLTLNLSKYFPFLLRGIAYQPTSIVVSLTNRCNCRCLMCNYWKFTSQNELTTNEVKDLFNQAKAAGVSSCILYGGEPLLRKDLGELISQAHQQGLKTEIITNGMLIDEKKAKTLVASGLDKVVISLDMCSDQLDQIRGIRGAYEKTLAALTELIKLKEQGKLEVMIASTLMLPTLRNNNLIKVIELAERLRVPVIIQLLDFSPLYFKGIDRKTKKELWIAEENYPELQLLVDKLVKIKREKKWLIVNSISSLNYTKRYFRDPRSKELPCYVVLGGRIWIDSQGKVYLCQALPALGDLRKASFRDIVNSKRWQAGVRQAFLKECPGCSCGYSLNVDTYLPYAWKDILIRKLSHKK